MKPFEVVGSDGLVYLHHDNWHRYRSEKLSVHPGEGKWRFDLDLRNPRNTLEEVPVSNGLVHSHGGYSPHTCFYECDDWSTIYEFYESQHGPMFRMMVESQNPNPIWGERITLLSTSTYFKSEPWGRNTPNQFAFFRGMYWQVIWSELLYHEFPAGVGYPLRDNGIFGVPRRGGQRQPPEEIEFDLTFRIPALNRADNEWGDFARLRGMIERDSKQRYFFPVDWRKEGF